MSTTIPMGDNHLQPFIGRVVIDGSVKQVADVKLNITSNPYANISWDSTNTSDTRLRGSKSGSTGTRNITPYSIADTSTSASRIGISKITYSGSTPYSLGNDTYRDSLVNGHENFPKDGYGWASEFKYSPYAGVTINGQTANTTTTEGTGLNTIAWDDMTAYTSSPWYVYADATLNNNITGQAYDAAAYYDQISNFPSQYYPTFNVGPDTASISSLNQGTYRFNEFVVLRQPSGTDMGKAYFRYGPFDVYGGGQKTTDITFNTDGEFRGSSSSEVNVACTQSTRIVGTSPYMAIHLGRPWRGTTARPSFITYYYIYGMNTFWTSTSNSSLGWWQSTTANNEYGDNRPYIIITAIKSQWGSLRPTANFTITGPMELDSNGAKSGSTNDWKVYSQGESWGSNAGEGWRYKRPECANFMYAAIPVKITDYGTITLDVNLNGIGPVGGKYTSPLTAYTYEDYAAARTITIA